MGPIESSPTAADQQGSQHSRLRPALEDLFEVVSDSARALVVIDLPEMVILRGNSRSEALFGRTSSEMEGKHASRLFFGADEIYTTIGLGALAAGAVASYTGSRRLAGRPEVAVWTLARLIELESGERVAAKLVSPASDRSRRDALDDQFAARPSLKWDFPIDDEPGDVVVTTHTHDVLDALPSRQREIVTALLQGERVSSIARALYVSSSTVSSHLTAIFAAFDVHTQAELLAILRNP